MSAFNPRKRWAVCVVIAWLATAISVWAFETSGKRALGEPACKTCRAKEDPCDLAKFKEKIPDLELAHPQPTTGAEILPCSQGCLRRWMEARVLTDFLLIPSYSALMAFIFLLLRAPRQQGDRPAGRPWAVAGILLALGIVAADCAENFLLLQAIGPRCPPDAETLRLLWFATATKWGTIALASTLAGVLALIRSTGWVTRIAGLLGLATGGVLAVGIYQASKPLLNVYGGVFCLFAFFLAALIHAVIVVVKPDPLYIEPTAGGEPKP